MYRERTSEGSRESHRERKAEILRTYRRHRKKTGVRGGYTTREATRLYNAMLLSMCQKNKWEERKKNTLTKNQKKKLDIYGMLLNLYDAILFLRRLKTTS